jgi:hypothetical protein
MLHGAGKEEVCTAEKGVPTLDLAANVSIMGEHRMGKVPLCAGRAVDIVVRFPDTADINNGNGYGRDVQAKDRGR